MKVSNAILILEKRGWKIEGKGEARCLTARLKDCRYAIAIMANGGDYAGEVATIRVFPQHDPSDSRQDYSSGTFCRTLAEALRLAA